jgi:hypothetical protein
MKIVKIAILITVPFLGYTCQESNKQPSNKQVIAPKEQAQTREQIDTLGPVIQRIDFKQKATGDELKTYEDGYISWISVGNPKPELGKLIDADKIILAYSKAKIIIDYPLTNPANFEITTVEKGFSRRELILKISEMYHEIYKLEESTAKIKTIPEEKREGLINRNQTDGKYGVWGHDLSDLDLSQIEVHLNTKGEITLTLVIES